MHDVLSSFAVILLGGGGKGEVAGYLTLIVFLLSCGCWCSVALPLNWSALCDCGISWSYSLSVPVE